jgi:hypothetical protein
MKYTYKKNIFLILFLASFSFIHSSGQVIQKETNDSVEVLIKEIKKDCDRINKDIAKFKVVQEDINDQSAEGGILKKFYDGKILRKAVFTFFGETGQLSSEGYFLNGEMIFVLNTEERYKAPVYMGKTEIESKEKDEFYFKNKKMIRWINNYGEIIDIGLFPGKEKEILDDFKNIH